MEIYKWKWMVLGVLGCMINADLKKKLVNNNTLLMCLLFVRIMTRASN
jgi:hypothetical protein